MSIFYCCLLFAVYCTLGQIWAAGGRDVIRNHMIPNDTKWHHMMLNDITWCPVTSHHHDILLHHMLMIPCYITRWWYPVQSHDVLRHHIPCQESGRWLQLLLIAPLQRSPGFRIQEMFWMWVTAAASLLYSSRGMQVKTNRELKRNDKFNFNTFFYLLIFKTTPLSLKYAQEVK